MQSRGRGVLQTASGRGGPGGGAWTLGWLEVLQFLLTARSGVDHVSAWLTKGGGHDLQEEVKELRGQWQAGLLSE